MQAVDPPGFQFPTLTLKQDRQKPVGIPHFVTGQLAPTRSKCLMAFPMMLATEGHSWKRNQPRCMALAQLVDLEGPLRKLTPCPRLHNFLCDNLLKGGLDSGPLRAASPCSGREAGVTLAARSDHGQHTSSSKDKSSAGPCQVYKSPQPLSRPARPPSVLAECLLPHDLVRRFRLFSPPSKRFKCLVLGQTTRATNVLQAYINI